MLNSSEGTPKEVREFTQDIVEGATKATLKLGVKKIKELTKKALNRQLYFIQDPRILDEVKKQLRSGEWYLCQKYLKNKKLKILVQMGLTLRQYEENDNKDLLNKLRSNIVSSIYGEEGLHITQFVQNKLLKEYITEVVSRIPTVSELIKSIGDLLNNLEIRVSFIQLLDDPKTIINEIKTRLIANSPKTYLAFARNSAMKVGLKVRDLLEKMIVKEITNYDIENRITKTQIIIFLTKKKSKLDEL